MVTATASGDGVDFGQPPIHELEQIAGGVRPAAKRSRRVGIHRHADGDSRQSTVGHAIEIAPDLLLDTRGRGRLGGSESPELDDALRETAAINASARPPARQPARAHAPLAQLDFRGEDTEAAEYRKGYNQLVRCCTRPP